jgi:hypothetical protein
MKIPQFIVTYRVLTVTITLLILLVCVLGDVGIGPLAPLLGPAAPKFSL